jgi:hypothetical protein
VFLMSEVHLSLKFRIQDPTAVRVHNVLKTNLPGAMQRPIKEQTCATDFIFPQEPKCDAHQHERPTCAALAAQRQRNLMHTLWRSD